jgi:hypothetical protein
MTKIREGDSVRVEDDRVSVDGHLVGVGVRQSEESILAAMDGARQRLASSSNGSPRTRWST